MKSCSKCGQQKQAEEFRSPQGHMCKVCLIERIRAYDRLRAKWPHRKLRARKITIAWRANHPDRYRAENAVNNAVRDGRLIKPDQCEDCGSSYSIHGHHDDYTQPLMVRWLCAVCHMQLHAQQ